MLVPSEKCASDCVYSWPDSRQVEINFEVRVKLNAVMSVLGHCENSHLP